MKTKILFILAMTFMAMNMTAQEAVVEFKSPVPMPKDMKE